MFVHSITQGPQIRYADLLKQDRGRRVKQEQEEISRNHIKALFVSPLQAPVKEWSLCYMKLLLPLGFTQSRDHSFAGPCIYSDKDF